MRDKSFANLRSKSGPYLAPGFAALLALAAIEPASATITTLTASKNCPNNTACDVTFAAVAAGKTFTISSVSCALGFTARPAITQFSLGSLIGNSYMIGHFLAPISDMGTDAQNVVHVNISTPVAYVAYAGWHPMVRVTLSTNSAYLTNFCTLTGVTTP